MSKLDSISLDKILKALGDPIRLNVMRQLLQKKNHEMTCGAFEYKVQKATFSHHIKILREARILCERIEGVNKYLSINPDLETKYPDIIKTIRKS